MDRFELKISTFMGMATQLATLATCPKRQVGCIFLDKDLRIIASGYNGVVSGEPHCDGKNCACTHAEINALNNCKGPLDVRYVITTCAPCADCFDSLGQLPVETIYYSETSKHSVNSSWMKHVAPFTPHWAASKVGGSYQAEGLIVSEFQTKAKQTRLVFEFNEFPGMLHIFTPKQLVGGRTKQLVPCFGTYPQLSSKQADENACSTCQIKVACEREGYKYD